MIKNALVLFFMCAAIFVFYLPSYMQMQDLHERNQAYARKIVQLEKDNAHLAEERARLQDDPEYFERMAREKMGLIRENEVIYKVLAPGQKSSLEENEETRSILKKEDPKAPAKTKAASSTKKAVAAAPVKTKAPVKKTSSPKTKTSATMSQSSKGTTSSKTKSVTSKTAVKSKVSSTAVKKSTTKSTSKTITNSTK